MKKLLFITLLICNIANHLQAQDTVDLNKTVAKNVIPSKVPQATFIEFGGSGILISLNYERAFSQQKSNINWRIGLGKSIIKNFGFTTIPFGINYLSGDKNHKLEFALNETLLIAEKFDSFGRNYLYDNIYIASESTTFITTLNFGYRYQFSKKGILIRAGLTPYLAQFSTGIVPYLALGYHF